MINYTPQNQLSLEGFTHPFDRNLLKDKIWVKLSVKIRFIMLLMLSCFITSCYNTHNLNREKENLKNGIWYEVLSDSIVVRTNYKKGTPIGKQIQIYPDGSKRIYHYYNGVKSLGFDLITKEGKKSLVITDPAF